MPTFVLLGLIAVILGGISLYLASANQRWLTMPLPILPARISSVALLALGWLSLSRELHVLTASFVSITALMLILALLPYVGALLDILRTR